MKQILDSAREYLVNNTKIRTAFLISMELPASSIQDPQFIYMTDYQRDVVYGGITYTTGKLKSISSHKQNRELTVGSLTFTITGTDEDELIRLVQQGVSLLDKSVSIYQAIIDDNGDILPVDPNTNGPLLFFRGKIVGGGIKDNVVVSGVGTSTISWNCSNEFYDFERVNGRFTSDASHRGLEVVDGKLEPSNGAKRDEYKEDFGFFHADKSVNILAKYQVKEERYKIQTKKKLFGLSSKVSLKKYYETVTKEVDMDINLTAKYLPVVYGTQKVPGIPVFADTEKNNPNMVYIVYAFCEGEIEGFLDFQFGDAPMICTDGTDSGARTCFGLKRLAGDTMQRIASGVPDSNPSTHGQEYRYNDGNGDIRIWTFHGKSDQTAAQVLVDIAAANNFYLQNLGGYGTDYYDGRFKLLDTAYAVVRFNITENRTEIPEVSAELSGRKVSVYKEDGSLDRTRTSQNGVWQTLDYLTSDIFGAGLNLSQIPLNQWVKESLLLDAIDTSYEQSWQPYWRYVGWRNPFEDSNRAIIQMNTVLDGADSVFQNIKGLLESFQGAINNLSGEYRVTVEKEATPLKLHFLDTYGDLDLSDTTGRTKYNSVQASIIDPALNWRSNAIMFFNSEFKNQDRGMEKKLQLSFANITNYYTARSMAARELKKSRYARELSFSLPYQYIGIEPNDAIAFTHERYGWVEKYFLVDSVENTRQGKINLTLKEYGPDVFINSDQVDNSGNDMPSVSNNVLPPRNFLYTPTSEAGTEDDIGKNGTLSWLPSLTTNVVYYTIRQTGLIDPYVINQNNADANTLMTQDIVGQPPGLTVFEIRAVDINGRRSSPVVLSVDINAARNLSVVPNFRVVNTATGDTTEFVGPDVLLQWDPVAEEEIVPDIFYTMEILDPTNVVLRSVRIENQHDYTYLLTYNKADYAMTHSDALGLNRQLRFRIIAEGPNGERSVDWANI